MRQNFYGMTAAANFTLTAIPAQSIEAIAVYFTRPVMAGSRLLPVGNYTISTLKDAGAAPVLRFQSELGESIALLATREYLPIDEVSQKSVLVVAADESNVLRVTKIAIEGYPFLFVVADPGD